MEKLVQVLNEEGIPLLKARVADGFRSRGLGLMFQPALPLGLGLWLAPCGSIHTCFMRFAIDAIFLDRNGRVTRVCPRLRPWRLASGGAGACAVLEVATGWLDLSRVRPGTTLSLQP